jgi:hypothetical protein
MLMPLNRSIFGRAIKVALVVGSILLVINQYDALFGDNDFRTLSACLTYCVPFCVFIFGQCYRGQEKNKPT